MKADGGRCCARGQTVSVVHHAEQAGHLRGRVVAKFGAHQEVWVSHVHVISPTRQQLVARERQFSDELAPGTCLEQTECVCVECRM
jgi:hypothetical protein